MADRTYLIENTLYAEVTNRIITALEAGVAPWVRPWRADVEGGRPRNGSTNRPYRGLNVLLTAMSGYASSRWYTFNQASLLKGRVRRGEKGTTLILWRFVETPRVDCNGAAVGEPDALGATTTARTMPLLRSYVVFNAEQIEWPTGSKHAPFQPTEAVEADDNYAEVEAVVAATGATIEHHGVRAFYTPTEDKVVVPMKSRFEESSAYYATLTHELGHWSGHEGRLNRNLTGRFGTESYAAEELVAELASAFLCADLGVAGALMHAEYIGSWIKVLKQDKKAIFTATRLAQEAADYILGRKVGGTLDEPASAEQEAA